MPATKSSKAKRAGSGNRNPGARDFYETTTIGLLRLFTQSKPMQSEFTDLVSFRDDIEHKATPTSKEVSLRVEFSREVATAGVFGAKRVCNEFEILRGILHRLHLEITDPDTDWSPSVKNMQERYVDCVVRKNPGNGKVLVHRLTGPIPDLFR